MKQSPKQYFPDVYCLFYGHLHHCSWLSSVWTYAGVSSFSVHVEHSLRTKQETGLCEQESALGDITDEVLQSSRQVDCAPYRQRRKLSSSQLHCMHHSHTLPSHELLFPIHMHLLLFARNQGTGIRCEAYYCLHPWTAGLDQPFHVFLCLINIQAHVTTSPHCTCTMWTVIGPATLRCKRA